MDRSAVRLMKEFLKSEVVAQKERKKAFRNEVEARRKAGNTLSMGRPWQIFSAKDSLRHLFAAYALARGRDWEYVTSHVDRPSQGQPPHKRGELSKASIQGYLHRFEKEAAAKAGVGAVEAQAGEAHAPGSQ